MFRRVSSKVSPVFVNSLKNNTKKGCSLICSKDASSFKAFSSFRNNLSEKAAVYPGAKDAKQTKEFKFVKSTNEPFPVFHVMDGEGNIVNKKYFEKIQQTLTDEHIVKIYENMIALREMDDILYNAQRQGRVSFYMTSTGEEAVQMGSAAALKDTDEIFMQYRETGVLLYRGFTLSEFLNQCFSTTKDYGKGRQMPVHYGSKKLRVQTISSPLATQIPQASGVGYGLKLEGRNDVCMCYFGEGAASEGDFHAALNFASTLKSQTIFFCRNNGYAISTPTSDQYAGDGIASRGLGYGMNTIRVDGNDLFAVYYATQEARRISIEQKVPVLIEAMTYRASHHSTSDDASRYRTKEELNYWTTEQNPIDRLYNFLVQKKLWNEEKDKEFRAARRKDVLDMLTEVEKADKTGLDELVTDVYDEIPDLLKEQKDFVDRIVEKYPEFYESSH